MNELLTALQSIQQISKEMKSGIYNFTENGKCSNCGQCCSNFLPLSAKEVKTIKRYIKKKGIKEQVNRFPTSDPIADFTCPFRSNSERKCLIYEVRPAICRDFQCDKPMKQISANKALYHGKYMVYEMRSEFFKEDL